MVYLADLSEEERAFLQREGRSIADDLEELTGATIERRKEGLALIAPDSRFSDRPFPAGGSANQAALLMASRLCERAPELRSVQAPHFEERTDLLVASLDQVAPEVLGVVEAPRPVRARSEVPFTDGALLDGLSRELVEQLAPALKQAHAESPARFLADALDVLEAHDLVRRVPGGVALLPALARFGEPIVEVEPELQAQLTFFGGSP